MSGNIPVRDQKILWGKSGNRCAIPECRKALIIKKNEKDKESIIGVMAHIKGENATAARYDAKMTDEGRNCYENLILVCGDHHKMIDDQRNTYTVEKLHEVKSKHETWVEECTAQEMVNVTFSELDVITKYLGSAQPVLDDSLTIVPPKDKIRRNSLSPRTEHLVALGLLQVKQVSDFLDRNPDMEFGERLKQGFVDEYERLKNVEGLNGDVLFDSLFDFSCQGRTDFKERAAGLAILVYFFEKCDVFEQ
jgi:hypothetical protein